MGSTDVVVEQPMRNDDGQDDDDILLHSNHLSPSHPKVAAGVLPYVEGGDLDDEIDLPSENEVDAGSDNNDGDDEASLADFDLERKVKDWAEEPILDEEAFRSGFPPQYEDSSNIHLNKNSLQVMMSGDGLLVWTSVIVFACRMLSFARCSVGSCMCVFVVVSKQ